MGHLIKWERALDPGALDKNGQALPVPIEAMNFASRLLEWYDGNGRKFRWRRSKISTYEVVLTEALLQRTRAETIEAFLPRFLSRYPGWKELAAVEKEKLEEDLRPIGLQKRRAQALSSLSRVVVSKGCRIPSDPNSIIALPGVGQYVFYAINLYRKNAPLPLLDASMARLLERYFGKRKLADIRYDPYLQQLARLVVKQGDHKRLNWAMLDLAALVCKPSKPLCNECPVKEGCQHEQD